VNAIAYARVHVPVGIAVNAIWDSRRSVREELAIAERAVLVDCEAIARQNVSMPLRIRTRNSYIEAGAVML